MTQETPKFKTGDPVLVLGDKSSPYPTVRLDVHAMVTGYYYEEGTGRLVYETTIGSYYADKVQEPS